MTDMNRKLGQDQAVHPVLVRWPNEISLYQYQARGIKNWTEQRKEESIH